MVSNFDLAVVPQASRCFMYSPSALKTSWPMAVALLPINGAKSPNGT